MKITYFAYIIYKVYERKGNQMDQILLCSNHIPLVTSINNSFIQKYMLNANGSYVKVYLYLSMCIQSGKENLSISSLADMMENTEKDILRALRYWEKQGLMRLQKDVDSNTITGIEIVNPDTLTAIEKDLAAKNTIAKEDNDKNIIKDRITTTKNKTDDIIDKTEIPKANVAAPVKKVTEGSNSSKISVTPEQTMRLAQDEDFSWACLIVESYLERPLTGSEVQLLSYLYDTLHFSKELILHLYEYCLDLHKTNIKYVQAVALSWAENNITTPEKAEEFSAKYSTTYTAISKALGLNRQLANIESQYVDRWQNQWNMDLAVILEACNRTMLAIQKPDFKYLDGILSNWHNNNVHTLQDIQLCDEKHNQKKKTTKTAKKENITSNRRNQFQTFQQHNTSQDEIDQLEKILLTR